MNLQTVEKKKVLVADDTSFFRTMLSYILTEQGYEVQSAADGRQAVSMIEEEWQSYSLFILDLMMPGMNGFEVLRRLRELDPSNRLAVLVITQYFLNDLERQILKKHQIMGYLNKTASMERILYEVNNILYPEAKNIRKNYRAPVNLPVTLRLGTETVITSAFNLSVEGIFVILQDKEPPRVGETINLKFWIPNSERLIESTGEVMWRNGFDSTLKKSHPPGIGVKFEGMSHRTKQDVEDYLKTLCLAMPMDEH